MFDNAYRGGSKSKYMPVITYYNELSKKEARIFTHMHYHDYFEFLYIKHGHVKMLINAEPFEAKQGNLIIINPYETHYGEILSEDLGYYCIVFDTKALSLPNETEILSSRIKYINHIPNFDKCEEHIDAINNAYTNCAPGWELSAKGNLLLIFSMLSEHITKSVFSSQYLFEKKVIDYVAENYMNNITSSDAAASLGYNHNYFCRAFRKSFSLRFCDYLNNYRIGEAKEMLKNKSISEVSNRTGYSNINYFSVVFRRITGLSPSEYRKQL